MLGIQFKPFGRQKIESRSIESTRTSRDWPSRRSVEGVDAQAGVVTLDHGPIESLKWPAMTMEFKVANPSLLKGIAPGARLDFEFVERQPGEWVITRVTPRANGPTPPPAAAPGHGRH